MSHLPQQGDLSSSSNSRMFGPYGNVSLNAASGGGVGINSGLPPPDHSFHTDIHHLQQQSVSVCRYMASRSITIQFMREVNC